MTLRPSLRGRLELGQRGGDGGRRRARRGAPAGARSARASAARVDGQEAAVLAGGERRGRGLGVGVDADHLLLAGLDGARRGSASLSTRRSSCSRSRPRPGRRPCRRCGPARRAASSFSCRDLVGHGLGAVEQVVVLQQVGLVGQDLLHAQRPLLVPRARQAERLVPGRQLHGAGAGVLATASPPASRAGCGRRCSRAAARSGPGELTCTP